MISIAHASAHTAAANSLVKKIQDAVLFPLISVMLAAALLFFLWGAFRFVANADDEAERTTGKRHMIFGILGMLIMISALSILRIAAGTFGVDGDLPRP